MTLSWIKGLSFHIRMSVRLFSLVVEHLFRNQKITGSTPVRAL